MRQSLKGTLIVLLFLLPGCATEGSFAKKYVSASVEPDRNTKRIPDLDRFYTVQQGENHVLELYWYWSRPLGPPDSYSEYSLFLQVDPLLLSKGVTLQVPAAGVLCFLDLLRAPVRRTTQNCSGQIEIKDIGEDYLFARLDIGAKDLRWSYRGEVTFWDSSLR